MNNFNSQNLGDIKVKKFFDFQGYVVFDNYFSITDIKKLKLSIYDVQKHDEVELYYDRSGLLRRMENFTFKNDFLLEINKKIEKLLYKLTHHKQNIFKDKVNFKPAKGEGFFPHYDGVFQFKKTNSEIKNGWYEYAPDFTNVLICLDDFTLENGTLEISKFHKGDFKTLFKNTKQNGSPDLREDLVSQLDFNPILAKSGSIVIFKHSCPHRSSVNYSSSERGSLYLTYNNSNYGNFYKKYFKDKKNSINTNKALLGEQS